MENCFEIAAVSRIEWSLNLRWLDWSCERSVAPRMSVGGRKLVPERSQEKLGLKRLSAKVRKLRTVACTIVPTTRVWSLRRWWLCHFLFNCSGTTTRHRAASPAGGVTGAGATASPTGAGARAAQTQKLTVTAGGSSVTFRVASNLVEGGNTERMFSSKSIGSSQKQFNEGLGWIFFEKDQRKVIFLTLRIYGLQSDTMYTLCT